MVEQRTEVDYSIKALVVIALQPIVTGFFSVIVALITTLAPPPVAPPAPPPVVQPVAPPVVQPATPPVEQPIAESTAQPLMPLRSSVQLPPPSLPSQVVTKHPEISKYFEETDNKDDLYVRIEKLARHLAESGLFREATSYYEWLSKQPVLSKERKELSIKNLKYVSRRWESSENFLNDIAQNNPVTAVITDDRVNFRQNPEIAADNIIQQLNSNAKLSVLQRSDSRQKIKDGNNYWYKVRAADGTEGWVYAQYLYFYLDTPGTSHDLCQGKFDFFSP